MTNETACKTKTKVSEETLSHMREAVRSSSSHLHSGRNTPKDQRIELAEKMGLSLYSAAGSCTLTVGKHKDMPGVVVKVVETADYYLDFAKMRLKGDITSEHFPEVYSVTSVDNYHIVIVEEIPHDVEWDEIIPDNLRYPHDYPEGPENMKTYWRDLKKLLDQRKGAVLDTHRGNFRKREDGTIVCIDPIYNPSQ